MKNLAKKPIVQSIDHLLDLVSNVIAKLDWTLEHIRDQDLRALADVDEFDSAGIWVHSQRVRAQIVVHSYSIGAECLYNSFLVCAEGEPIFKDASRDFKLTQSDVNLHLEQITVRRCL